jgi:hypothetical protein
MKKLSLVVLGFVLLLSFSACQKSANETILGSWKNTSTDVTKLDQISSFLFDLQVNNLEDQIESYSTQVDLMDDTSRFAYEQIISNLQTQLDDLSVDSVKSSIIANFEIGTFTFNEDSSLTIKTKMDSVDGKWNISVDELTLNLEVQSEVVPLKISEISKDKLVIVQSSNIDTINFEVTYSFER